ncbi:metalloregulator ArsR/SmtB family transcription factor [Propionivibrio dicarboxylicus]|uniref:ArsR family transcriptional regulator n=1 Tax=Propionivibrio dicarboxylicus TaxID=83767 RepID=A0A1G8AH81_9RHOO|nr:metalloregulator ArsR/SmtB family transcription factor [Propionivibrio dicarboxylicus]SDH20213.1 ArsR family transcriptional regulator [Propionivibrio dicarboxylicus]
MTNADTREHGTCGCALSARGRALLFGLSSLNRLRVLYALEGEERCVGELVDTLGLSQSLVSQQLSLLLDGKLVSARRSGRRTYYAIAIPELNALLKMARETYRHA